MRTPTSKVARILKKKLESPMRDNMVKSTHVTNNSNLSSQEASLILTAMVEGRVDGVGLERVGNMYSIEYVERIPDQKVIVDERGCGQIRRALRGTNKKLAEVAEETGFNYDQARHHAVGVCVHDIEEPPVQSMRSGNEISWVTRGEG